MKRISCIFLLALCPNIISQHNVYLGINAGIASIVAKRDDYTINNSPLHKDLADNKAINNKSGLVGIFIGYLFRFKNFGAATELFAEYENLESKIEEKYHDNLAGDENSVQVHYKLTGPFGMNFKIGYFLYDNFLYALFGWQKQKLRYQANLTNAPVVNVVSQFAQTKNKHINGINLGVGFQRPINENYLIGLEFKVSKASARNFETDFKDNYETKLFSNLRSIKTYSCCLRFMYTF